MQGSVLVTQVKVDVSAGVDCHGLDRVTTFVANDTCGNVRERASCGILDGDGTSYSRSTLEVDATVAGAGKLNGCTFRGDRACVLAGKVVVLGVAAFVASAAGNSEVGHFDVITDRALARRGSEVLATNACISDTVDLDLSRNGMLDFAQCVSRVLQRFSILTSTRHSAVGDADGDGLGGSDGEGDGGSETLLTS